MEVSGDLSTSTLYISLPQAYLEYNALNWDPPARWDEGVSGVLMDYNLTAQSISQKYQPAAHQPDRQRHVRCQCRAVAVARRLAGPYR